jgi:hypothetical protein
VTVGGGRFRSVRLRIRRHGQALLGPDAAHLTRGVSPDATVAEWFMAQRFVPDADDAPMASAATE